MQEEDRKALRSNREALLKDLEAKRVASLLYSREIFTEEDKDSVNAKSTPAEQREEVLDILPRKGPRAFSVFCNVLHEVTPHLEELLRPTQEDDEGIDGPGSTAPIPASGVPSENNDQADAKAFFSFGGGGSATKSSANTIDNDTIYKMNKSTRGVAVIINNKDFLRSSGMDRYPRNGTDVDRDALAKLFRALKFDVRIYNNQTRAEIRRITKDMATTNHSSYDAFIFSILTHGEEGVIYGTDGTMAIKDLTAIFKDCPTLVGKPKMFFFQACQGHEYMDGMDVTDAPQQGSKVSVPAEADFVYAYSTVPGYYSWRNSVNGSWFIQSLTKVFEENAGSMDILRMLTRVNAMVSTYKSRTGDYYSDSKRQVSSVVSMLRKELYFFPENVTNQS